ncbi:MAG: SpoVR family protein [Patescibacteria group bacterium]
MVKKHKGPPGKGLGYLKKSRDEIKGYAIEYGLDFFDTYFEFLDFEEMNIIAAYGGFPNRYPSWEFGMEYERLQKSYRHGLHTIYEMVINNDPCWAYLLESNNLVDQKIVMAHVFGHSDFFKNNASFSQTNRKMMDAMANHATKVRKYVDRYGIDTVESFIDLCRSISDLIDPHSVFIKRQADKPRFSLEVAKNGHPQIAQKIPAKEYMNGYINPKNVIDAKQGRLDAEFARQKQIEQKQDFPENPERDVMLFLIEHAPLEEWQREILWIMREEAYYFAPQAETKIMNEGWATYWHEKIMIEKCLTDSEIIDFADHHSGTVAARAGQINPYRLGWKLWKDIEDRWNKGKFGKEYEECENYSALASWDKKLGLGRDKIFEVRKIYNDISFVDEFFTEEFCLENNFFTYVFNKEGGVYEIADRNWKNIKRKLLFSLTNFGRPFICVKSGNFQNRSELLLQHRHEGIDLRQDFLQDTLENLRKIWGRTVHIETVAEGAKKLFSSKPILEESKKKKKKKKK